MVDRPDLGHLARRRQFVLGPGDPDAAPEWRVTRVASRFSLAAHPDLTVTQASGAGHELTLIGLMLDPDFPERDDREVLEHLVPAAGDDAALHAELRRMGGRWALVVAAEGRDPYLLHDACGLRQVVYAITPDGAWCASEPGLLADRLALERDASAASFLASLYVRSYREFWWPGSSTPFMGAVQLLPNHALQLTTGAVHRYWPSAPRRRSSLAEGAEEAARLLRGIVEAAAHRYPLALALTAGVDSRAVLAAGRGVADSLYVYTLTNPALGFAERDAAVAEGLAGIAGVAHHRIACPSEMDRGFAEFWQRNTATAHAKWGATVEGLLAAYPSDRVLLTGNCSEISRRGYRRIRRLDPQGLADLENMVGSPFALDAIDAWLADARRVPEDLDYFLVDLYYWETRMGRWLASGHQEFDVVQETIAPFNCRAIAEALLALDIPDRDPPKSRAHKRIVELLWPELLAVPFNPQTRSEAVRTRVAYNVTRTLRATPAYTPLKALQLRIRARARSS